MEMTPKEAENIIKKANKFCDKLQDVLQTVCHDDYVQVSVYSINTEPGTEEAEIKAGIEIPSYDLTMSYTIGHVWDYRDGVVGCPEYDDLCIKVLEFFCAIVGEYVATIPKL